MQHFGCPVSATNTRAGGPPSSSSHVQPTSSPLTLNPAGGEGPLACEPLELGAFTPTFLWLLRDFYFDLTDEGRKVGHRAAAPAAHDADKSAPSMSLSTYAAAAMCPT